MNAPAPTALQRGVAALARRVFRLCLHGFPWAFRHASAHALCETFDDQLEAARRRRGAAGMVVAAAGECVNALAQGLRSRFAPPAARRRPPRRLIGSLTQDLRFAVRDFRTHPGFLVTAVVLLSLGIGSNTAIFSLVHAYLLRPLPFPEADRLVDVAMLPPHATRDQMSLIPEEVWQIPWPQRDEVIDAFVSWDLDELTIVGDGEPPEAVLTSWVTPGYFAALGTTPLLGRVLNADDALPGAPPVTLISHALWQRRFAGDPAVVGRTVTAYSGDRPDDAEVFTIVGVLRPDFWFFNRFTEMLPALRADRPPYMLRLQPGVTLDRAAQHLTDIARGQIDGVSPEWRMFVHPMHARYVENARPVLLVLAGTVGLVLLISCGNVAILFLVRAVHRERELTVRRALGASRGRIARQLLTEGLVLAAAAGALGIALAWTAVGVLAPTVQRNLGLGIPGGADAAGLDPVVLAAAVALSAATGIIFALVPALAAARADITGALNEGGRANSDSPRRQLARSLLIGGEVAVSLSLLIGAGLMIRSVSNLQRLDLGFEPEQLLSANVTLRLRSYPEGEDQVRFFDDVLARYRSLPGVSAATLEGSWPFQARAQTPTRAFGGDDEVPAAHYRIGDDYFRVMGIPLVRGRAFSASDRAAAAPVAIISQALADRLWPGRDPLGQRLQFSTRRIEENSPTVVGVVGDVREDLMSDPLPDVYVPYRQSPGTFVFLIGRVEGPAAPFARALQRIVWEVDPTHAVTRVETFDVMVSRAGARPRFLAVLLSGFSLFAVLLAVFGLYSVISFAATQRQQDVAIRMALGAQGGRVVQLFLKQGGRIVTAGIVVGVAASIGLASVLASQLYGVGHADVPTYLAAATALAVAALLAVWIPARRAARADPMTVLRT